MPHYQGLASPLNMATWITLAEYATVHTDGTVTVVRAGLDHWWPEQLPAEFSSYAYAEIDPAHLGGGEVPVSLQVHAPDGQVVAKIEGTIRVDKAKSARLVFPVFFAAAAYGDSSCASAPDLAVPSESWSSRSGRRGHERRNR